MITYKMPQPFLSRSYYKRYISILRCTKTIVKGGGTDLEITGELEFIYRGCGDRAAAAVVVVVVLYRHYRRIVRARFAVVVATTAYNNNIRSTIRSGGIATDGRWSAAS